MAPSGQVTAPALQALLRDATLAGNWTLDASKSTIGLRSRSVWGLAPVKGVFREVTGKGSVSPAGEVTGTITVGSASVDTKNSKRDTHLRSGDFFDTDNHPDITFTLDRLTPAGDGVSVTGTLTVRGRTRPISFPARVSVLGPDEVWLDAEVHVNRADFGLTWNQMGMASMHNTITVHAAFGKH
jgi:polyisoprenoid-binding protein YceI